MSCESTQISGGKSFEWRQPPTPTPERHDRCPRAMAPHQLAFWRELLAPFAPNELSEVPARGGKKTLTYVDSRALMNRLDSVCGPHGWDIEYRPTERGYSARMGIAVPTGNEGTSVWMYKEDGAGFEEMGFTNKQTGEFEYDVDNDEKSGYTNALRRAAQDAWGIGRYLYNKGIPAFLDPNARPLRPPPPGTRPRPARPPTGAGPDAGRPGPRGGPGGEAAAASTTSRSPRPGSPSSPGARRWRKPSRRSSSTAWAARARSSPGRRRSPSGPRIRSTRSPSA